MKQQPHHNEQSKQLRRASYLKIAALIGFAAAVLTFLSLGWFAISRIVAGNGMGIRSAMSPFELKTSGSAGLYDGFLDGTVSGYGNGTITSSSANIKWKLTKNTSEINNLYDGEGTPNLREITRRDSSDYGLKPGDSGTLKFSIVPNVSDELSINLKLNMVGYEAEYELEDDVYYKKSTPLTIVTNENVNHFLTSHICFFYEDSENHKHIIGSDGFTVAVSEETEVTLYWVWPATLREIIEEDIEGLDDTGASNEAKRLFFEHPGYFLKTLGSESFDDITVSSMENKTAQDAAIDEVIGLVSGRNYNEYGSMYNAADQASGDDSNYILVELTADVNHD